MANIAVEALQLGLQLSRVLAVVEQVLSSDIIIPRLQQAFTGDLLPANVLASVPSLLELDQNTALVVFLVLQQEDQHKLPSTPCSGTDILRWMAEQLALPSAACAHATSASELTRQLVSSSLVQMHLARDMALAALALGTTCSNCFTLLAAATHLGLPPLETSTKAFALAHFQQALACDAEGLRHLSAQQLVSLLSDDALQVASESVVFIALLTWSQGSGAKVTNSNNSSHAVPRHTASAQASAEQEDAWARRNLASLCEQCVRSGLLGLKDLEALDGRPEVAKCEEALRTVAGVVSALPVWDAA